MQESRKCNVALWDDLWETQTFYFTKFYFTELFQTNTDTLGQKKLWDFNDLDLIFKVTIL